MRSLSQNRCSLIHASYSLIVHFPGGKLPLHSEYQVNCNMNVSRLRNLISLIPSSLLWVCIAFLSILLAHNATLYFTHGGEYGILPEKRIARMDWIWNLCFYVHLPSGVLCLLLPWFSFAKKFSRITRTFHSKIGTIYTWITIAVVCPTGMYLALYAKGGLITATGFMLQGALLGYFTFRGYQAVRQGNRQFHIQNMIRSYSVALVVLTFRILHLLFFFMNVPYADNYAISQWLGLTINLLIAESIISLSTQKYPSLKTSTL
jgi:hypothetical protein